MNWNLIKYFSPEEMICPCCGRCDMDIDFMMRLDWLRRNAGYPFPVNSGYRCKTYDVKVGGAMVHPSGHGADIKLYGFRALRVVSLASRGGFTGFGIKQNGPRLGRYIHLDDLSDIPGVRPRGWIWSY